MSESFWRCDDCGETWGMTYHVAIVRGGVAGIFGDRDDWEEQDVDVVVDEDASWVKPVEELDGEPVRLPPPPCGICGRPMRRVVGVLDARDWETQFT
jgi:hypothetical protein